MFQVHFLITIKIMITQVDSSLKIDALLQEWGRIGFLKRFIEPIFFQSLVL